MFAHELMEGGNIDVHRARGGACRSACLLLRCLSPQCPQAASSGNREQVKTLLLAIRNVLGPQGGFFASSQAAAGPVVS